MYVSRVIRPARGFLNRMLQTLRNTEDGKRVEVAGEFKLDSDWFLAFIKSFNGTCTFRNWGDSSHGQVHIDASLWGLGAVYKDKFYSTPLPTFIRENQRIVVFEMTF